MASFPAILESSSTVSSKFATSSRTASFTTHMASSLSSALPYAKSALAYVRSSASKPNRSGGWFPPTTRRSPEARPRSSLPNTSSPPPPPRPSHSPTTTPRSRSATPPTACTRCRPPISLEPSSSTWVAFSSLILVSRHRFNTLTHHFAFQDNHHLQDNHHRDFHQLLNVPLPPKRINWMSFMVKPPDHSSSIMWLAHATLCKMEDAAWEAEVGQDAEVEAGGRRRWSGFDMK